jgi:segregation and condensation protein B
VTKRKKPDTITALRDDVLPPRGEDGDGPTARRRMTPEEMQQAMRGDAPEADDAGPGPESEAGATHERTVMTAGIDPEMTVNLSGDDLPLPGRDDFDAPTVTIAAENLAEVDHILVQRKHLRGLLEALVFASDSPIKPHELGKLASAPVKQVKELLAELQQDYATRGMHLEEVAGGWVFRTSTQYAPFIRDLTKQKPVRLTRAQVETLAIIAYRQPITRPEVDDVRGVDSGPVLKLLLERDLVRILGKRDEPGRPLIYGTTTHFLEFFGLKSLKDLPTLREFTELTDESRQRYEEELGDLPENGAGQPEGAGAAAGPDPAGASEALTEDAVPALGEDAADAAAHADDQGDRDEAPPRESMRVQIGDQAAAGLDEIELAPEDLVEHEADRDDPTITSGAPAGARDHDGDGDGERDA